MNSKIKIGKLYFHNKTDLEPRFCEIKDNKILNNAAWGKRVLVKSNQPIMILEEFDMTSATVTAVAAGTATAIWTARWMADWKEVRDLWKRNKRISGYKSLFEDKIIWISEFDLKHFKSTK